jgi:XTP/dITP diphosphohydrolase
MNVLVLATRNRDKVREITRLLEGLPVRLVPIYEWATEVAEVEETGETLEENAILKARETARLTGEAALADDTGLEVTALGGAPGVYAARYAGESATYADNWAKLLDALREVPEGARGAVFRTVVALATPEGVSKTVEGRCEGRILPAARGESGFGYDPVFSPEGETRSFAEMSLEEKNACSHRARAFHAARSLVSAWLAGL